jgi:hypothetical protein
MVMTIDDLMDELDKIARRLAKHNKWFIDEMYENTAIALAKDVEVHVVEGYRRKDFFPIRAAIVGWITLELVDWASVGGIPPRGRREKLKDVITTVFQPWEYDILLERIRSDIAGLEALTREEIEIRELELKGLEKGKK